MNGIFQRRFQINIYIYSGPHRKVSMIASMACFEKPFQCSVCNGPILQGAHPGKGLFVPGVMRPLQMSGRTHPTKMS